MSQKFVSPGVFTNEVDESFLAPGVASIGPALIGLSPKGPAFVPVSVPTYAEFANVFGDLDKDYNTPYAARAYLQNGTPLNMVRVLGPSGRTVNGTTVTAGYTADSTWAITATGSVDAVLALVQVTSSAELQVEDLNDGYNFKVTITGSDGEGFTQLYELSCSFLSSSDKYIKKVLNTDATKFSEKGYFVRSVYDYALKSLPTAAADVGYSSSSYGLTDYTTGYQGASTPWIESQDFSNTTYNLFKIHTLGDGVAENGRFKISISNIKTSATDVSDFGSFDLTVRMYGDNDDNPAIVESFTNLTLDPNDRVNFICKRIGDQYWKYDVTNDKMVRYGTWSNVSKYIRVELATDSYPDAALPWGFEGLAKPDLGVDDTASAVVDLPYVADLKKFNGRLSAEARDSIYWGVEFLASGSIEDRLQYQPLATGSDAVFSLTYVSGNSLDTFAYNASNPNAAKKQPGDTTSHTVLAPKYAKFTVPLAFGFDGFDEREKEPLNNESNLASVSQLGTQAVRQAIDIIKDPDFIDINLLVIPGIHASTVTDYAIDKVEDRADTLYIMDVTGSTPAEIISQVKGRNLDTNYAAVYYPGIRVEDPVNGGQKVLPPSVPALAAIGYNDRVADSWWAPAGLNRAGLNFDVLGFNSLGLNDELKASERDDLYDARINPIARFPNNPRGVIWGQKTLQLKASALDRINVRRLLITAKKLVSSATRFLVFEPNNAATRTRFKQLVNPILANIQLNQGLEDFRVVMDETTTTPDLVDRNIMAGKIFLIPTRAAEYIQLDFVISPTGATFGE